MRIVPPLTDEVVESLHAGDRATISGVIYVARDAAHQRMVEAMRRGELPPFDLKGQIIYYMGPSPAKPGQVIGSAGPTTAYRMDPYTPFLLANGLKGMIGKGSRSSEVRQAIRQYKGVYFGAVGGTGALLARRIRAANVVAYDDLGAEAVLRLVVEDFPVLVINDIYGGDLYEQGKQEWSNKLSIG